MTGAEKTVSDIFEAFGGPSALSRALDLKGVSTASEMKRRGRISVDCWPRLVELGASRDIKWLTYEALVRMHVRRAKADDWEGAFHERN